MTGQELTVLDSAGQDVYKRQVEYPSTTEILADLHELEMEITKGLAELEEMV